MKRRVVLEQTDLLKEVREKYSLQQGEINEIGAKFQRYDPRCTGFVVKHEVDDVLRDLGLLENDKVIRFFNEELKSYPGKQLDFKQVCGLYCSVKLHIEHIEQEETITREYIDAFVALGGNLDTSGYVLKKRIPTNGGHAEVPESDSVGSAGLRRVLPAVRADRRGVTHLVDFDSEASRQRHLPSALPRLREMAADRGRFVILFLQPKVASTSGHGLGQVLRFVRVQVQQLAQFQRDQLEGDRGQDPRQVLVEGGDLDDLADVALLDVLCAVGNDDGDSMPGADLAESQDHVLEVLVVQDDEDGGDVVDQGERAVLQLARAEGFCVLVRLLLQLQGAFPRDRLARALSQDDDVLALEQDGGSCLGWRVCFCECLADDHGEGPELVDDAAPGLLVVAVDGLVLLLVVADPEDDEDEGGDGGEEGLGGGHGHFAPAVHVHAAVHVGGDHGPHHVDHAHREHSLLPHLAQHPHDVLRLARLAHHDHPRAQVRDVVAHELTRLDRVHAVEQLQSLHQRQYTQRGVEAAPTSQQRHVLDRADLLLLPLQPSQLAAVLLRRQPPAVPQRPQKRARLLEDLLLEETRIWVSWLRVVVDVHVVVHDHPVLERPLQRVPRLQIQLHYLPVLQRNVVRRVLLECNLLRRHEN